MYNTSASELEGVASDLSQIARTYTSAAHTLDQQVITLEGAVTHVLNDGVMQWKGLSSEAFVSAWLERRARLTQASTLMSTSATDMTTLVQTIESNLPMIRAGQSIQTQPIFASMASNDQQAVLAEVSQAQNAIFMALNALNSQLEALAAEVGNCPEVDRNASTPGLYDNVSRNDVGEDVPPEGGGSGSGKGDDTSDTNGSGNASGIDPYGGSNSGGETSTDLINELKASGKKFNEQEVVGITRTPDGEIVWLENGNSSAGLDHIMNGDGTPGDIGHGADFANIGVDGPQDVTKLIIDTLQNETPIAITSNGARTYSVLIKGVLRRILIVVGKNGFIVTAFPL